MDSIKEQIFQLENDLIKSEVRKSAEKINEILSNDFVEFSSSGSEYHYKCGDVFLYDSSFLCRDLWYKGYTLLGSDDDAVGFL